MKRWSAWLAYSGLALLILVPLLGPGYVFAMDMFWEPHLAMPLTISSSWVLFAALHFLNLVFPSWFIQKVLLLGIFVLAGVGAYKLTEDQLRRQPAAYFAGLIYMVNPFIYTRLMAGQYLVLLGYALLPWFARSLRKLMERPNWKHAAEFCAWAVALSLCSIHAIWFIALLGLIIAVSCAWGRRGSLRQMAGWLAAAIVGWLVLSAFWLVPILTGRGGQAQEIAGFGGDQFMAYATQGDGVGVPFNTLILQGFWADTTGKFVLPSSTGILFWLCFAIIIALVIKGIWWSVVRRDRLGIALAVAAVIAWILAMGIAWPPVAGFNHWLIDNVPFYRGYREPQKWAALIALAYAYLGAVGLGVVAERFKGWAKDAVVLSGLLLPLLWVPMLLWGAGGQLRSVDYPASWYQLNQRLNAEPGQFKVLMLPWHQYIGLDFAGRSVANPAPAFFDRPTVVSTDPEIPGVAVPQSPDNRLIENNLLPERFYEHDAGVKLRLLKVRYVVLLKQSDWRMYGWLNKQNDLKLIDETDGWKLYRVEIAK